MAKKNGFIVVSDRSRRRRLRIGGHYRRPHDLYVLKIVGPDKRGRKGHICVEASYREGGVCIITVPFQTIGATVSPAKLEKWKERVSGRLTEIGKQLRIARRKLRRF